MFTFSQLENFDIYTMIILYVAKEYIEGNKEMLCPFLGENNH